MLKHMRSRLAPGLAILALCQFAIAADPDIAALAPQRSFLVASVPSWAELNRSFEASELGKLWNEPAVQTFVEKFMKDANEELATFLKETNVEIKDLKPPTGQVGLALYLPEKAPEREAWDVGLPNPHMLIAADLGENADAWEDALERLIEHGVKEKHITTEHETFAGVEVRILKPVYEETNTPADPDDEEADFTIHEDTGGIAGLIGGSSKDQRNLYIGRVGSTLVASTEMPTLERAIDALSGKDQETVGDLPAYRDAALQRTAGAGGAQGELAYAVVFPATIFEGAAAAAPEGENVKGLFDAFGISAVNALSLGMRLNTQEAAAEFSVGVLVPEKKGILALFEPSPGPFEPPAFVPSDTADISRFNFNFAKVPDLVRAFAKTMPEEQQQMILGGFEQMSNIIVPTLEAMGPAVHYITSYRQPHAPDSAQITFAIDLKDQAVVANTITFLSGQAGGLVEPREFEGNTIYGSGQIPIALGLGFNKLFIGETSGVENAMRLAGQAGADGAKLADEPRFRDAARSLSPDGIAYSYTDMEQTLRWTWWEFQNAAAIAEKQFEDLDMDDTEREELIKSIKEDQPEWLADIPPVELLLRYLGDSITEMHSTPDGFRGRSLLLRPKQ